MRSVLRKFWFFLLFLFCFHKNVWAVGTSFLGGLAEGTASASLGSDSNATAGYNPTAYGGGVLFDFNISKTIKIEAGGLYMPRGFILTSGGTSSSVQLNTAQFPLALRVFILPAISFGLGGYFSHTLSTPNKYKADDVGALFSMAIKTQLIPYIFLVVDGRFLLGSSNISQNAADSTYLRDFQFLAGLSFGN